MHQVQASKSKTCIIEWALELVCSLFILFWARAQKITFQSKAPLHHSDTVIRFLIFQQKTIFKKPFENIRKQRYIRIFWTF